MSKATTPAGQRPPLAGTWLGILRAVWLLGVLALVFAGDLPGWLGAGSRRAGAGALVLRVVEHPVLARVVLAGALVLFVELGIAALVLVAHRARPVWPEGVYLRIRAARTPRSRASAGTARPAGEDWFRAVHSLFGQDRTGTLTCLLTGRLDTPAELGVRIAGGKSAETRATWVRAITKIIAGHVPDSLVDERPDPLDDAALAPGAWVAWQELGLQRGPEHPLRFASTAEQADLLAPLVKAVSPPVGVARTQVQLILRPRRDWLLTRGWRAAALRRLLQLKARQDYTVGDEAATLEQKLDSPVYDATLRIVAVGTSAELATAGVDQVVAVLGQYTARSGRGVQTLRRRARCTFQIPPAEQDGPSAAWAWAGLALTLLALVAALAGWRLPLSQLHSSQLPSLPLPVAVSALLPQLLTALLPLAGALLTGVLMQERHSLPLQRKLGLLRGHAARVVPPPTLLCPAPLWAAPAILSPDELRGLWHLPTAGLSGMVQTLPNLYIPPPDYAFIPPDATDRVPLGTGRHSDGTCGPVGPRLFDLNQIFHMTGGMGAGKSQMFANVILWLIQRRHGFTYFEGKPGDKSNLLQFVRLLLSLGDERRLVIIDPLDVAWPVGINPIARIDLSRPDGADQALGTLDSVLARLDPERWGSSPGMQQYLQMGTLLVVEAEPLPTVAHIKQCLLDERYRERLLERCTNTEVRTFWQVTFPQVASNQKTSLDALLRRFDQLLVPEMVRHMITTSTFRFERAIEERWMVLICVPTDRLGNIARALAMLLFQSFALAAFERGGTALSREPYPLILDEFQELIKNAATHDVERAITQFRSQGTPGMFAHQGVSQLGELQDLMFTNAQNRVVPTIIGGDADMYAKLYDASQVTAADISGQPPEHRYASFLVNRRPTGLFSMEPLPWPEPLAIDVPPAPPLDWQSVLPQPADPIDPWLARLVYGDLPSPGAAVAVLARADGATWAHIQARWEVLRTTHRALILRQPGLIPDRLERQQWLSRLLAAMPWVLAAATYQRQRWEVAPGEAQTSVSAPRGSGAGRGAPTVTASGVVLPPGVSVPVSGLTPSPGEQPATPLADGDRIDVEQALRDRPKRREEASLAAGFDALGEDV
ncbi:MAG TPA: hypothetical protein VFS21_07490 [Roseiflexaceae bacterium]|nr:hypothetical protein [Roseiflexaceae bacterium]